MRSRDIVRKAWQITQVHLKKLIWYGAVPSFFSVIVSSVYLAYQYNAFKHSQLFSSEVTSDVLPFLRQVWEFVSTYPWLTVSFVIFAILFLIGYVITPPIFHGTLIAAIMRIKDYRPIHGAVEIGVRRFFPMFEFGLLTGSFSITTLFTESSFVVRWWGVNVMMVILPVFLFIAMVGLIVSFLFTYAQYFIVLEDRGLIDAIKESAVLVIANLRKTILVFVLMLLIGVRIILNVLLVLLIPMVIVILSSYFATIFSSTIGLVAISVFSLAILLVASYLLGLFHVFSTAVWVLTFDILSCKEGEQPKIHDVDLAAECPPEHGHDHPVRPVSDPPNMA
ncbi:hypothetical protein COY07_02095 [Candidatus Peregrinibacteria bacterium CG_4_10_14_0_2_um_filter_43_11]|nr:MAG: hypothetical protein COY07_02095 [Candidatus Peregrinibacteria bacterium CG_4_10_14_0_2_um_filter_43_11]